MKVRREVGMSMKWAWLRIKEMTVCSDVNGGNIDLPEAVQQYMVMLLCSRLGAR